MSIATASRRVVLYGRTSDDQSEGRSVDDQLAEGRRWALTTVRTVVAELRDDGISASRYAGRRKTRPDWQKAMDLITTRQVDELAVWEVSRSTRDRAVWSALIAACIENGVDLAVGGKVHDPADPDDGFMLDLGAALAVREVAMLSKRVRRAVESRAAAGRPAGSVPYGYRRVIDPDTGRTIGRSEHPEQAPIVREIVRRLLAREPANAIATDLNDRGVPLGTGDRWLGRHLRAVVRAMPEHPAAVEIAERLAGGQQPKRIAADLNERGVSKPLPARWRGGNLAKLALRPTYAGLRVHHGRVLEDVQGTWPPIVTEAEHHQLVAMFGDPGRDKFRNPTHTKHLGSGIYRCGREGCDGVMRVAVQVDRPHRYDCRECHKVSRHQEPVDLVVESTLWERLSRPDVAQLLGAGADDATKDAAAEAGRLRAKLDEARRKVDDDELTLDDLAYFRARWEPKIRDAERRARPRHLPLAVFDVAGPDAERRWKLLPIGERRAILAALLEVTILPAGRGSWRFDPDLIQRRWKGAS